MGGATSFDVLVVGAGPAGSIAATVLARAGARVCLVDRASFPRPKLCGDTLNPGAVAVLRRLGLASCAEPDALWLEGMRVTGDQVVVDGRYPGMLRGLAIRRHDLDWALVNAAARAGVEFRPNVGARRPLMREDRRGTHVGGAACALPGGTVCDIAAPVTIAADGRRSTLAFGLGLARHPAGPRRWAIGAHATDVHGMSPLGEMHIRHGYYIGVAPLPGGIANVCLVRAARGRDDGVRDPLRALTHALANEPMLRDRFADARFIAAPIVLGPLAVDAVPGARPARGLLVAGDAAGFIDPMTGDGLRFALRGGELAAHAALRALDGGWDHVHASLERERRHEFSGKWRFNRLLRGLSGSSLGISGASVAARVAPGLVRTLIRHASDCSLALAAAH